MGKKLRLSLLTITCISLFVIIIIGFSLDDSLEYRVYAIVPESNPHEQEVTPNAQNITNKQQDIPNTREKTPSKQEVPPNTQKDIPNTLKNTSNTQDKFIKQEDISLSPWIQYRNNWDGETLIQSDANTRDIVFPMKYIEAMTKKGPHPLTSKYPTFLERLNYIYDHCPNLTFSIDYRLTLRTTPYYLHFNDDYQVLYCLVPKAASFLWARQFGKMQNPIVPSSQRLVYNISVTNHMERPVETARRIQTFTKFFVRRHPFERLVSAYINKFEDPPLYYYMDLLAKEIIIYNHLQNYPTKKKTLERDFQHLPTSQKQEILKQINRLDSAQDKFNITFTEFVNFITSSMDNEDINKLDIHWKPISRICNPCAVRYDVVIEHDNHSEESQMLVDYLQMNKPNNNPLYFEPYPRISTRDKCNRYFTRLSKGLRQKLYELYRDDFLLFGYECNIESESSACDGV